MTGRRPRLAFVGLGWIGGLRLDALRGADTVEVAALCEADPERLQARLEESPGARGFGAWEDLLDGASDLGLDGLVVATPNALHTEQALDALDRGLPVFVQKPLGIDPAEVETVLRRAEALDLLVGVDLSYRGLEGARRLRELVRDGALGEVFHAEGVFHNAYGPDKAWCYDRALAGGGALLDLGVHLLDLTLWCLDRRSLERATGWIREVDGSPGIDSYGVVEAVVEGGCRASVAASWHAHTGRDCEIRLTLHGTEGSAEIRDLGGSFFDFALVRRHGRSEERVVEDHHTWMDRPILEWADRVRRGEGFDPEAWTSLPVARALDAVYRGADPAGGGRPAPEASPSSSAAR